MNRLAAILPSAQALVQVDATSKKRAFEEAGLLFENLHGLNRAMVADSLFARSIQIFIRAFGKQVAAFDMDIALGALSAFFFFLLFHCQQHTHINDLVKVSQDAIEFVGDVASQCRRDFKMVTADG